MFKVVALTLFILSFFESIAQRDFEDQSALKKRFYFEGGFGFEVRQGFARTTFNPTIGYMISNGFSAGSTFHYPTYLLNTNPYSTQSMFDDRYGFGLYIRRTFKNNIFVQIERAVISIPSGTDRENYNRNLLGLGYLFHRSKRGSLNIALFFDATYNSNSGNTSKFANGIYYINNSQIQSIEK